MELKIPGEHFTFDEDIMSVCSIMNNTLRKCLEYRTPQEVLGAHLQQVA